MRSAAFVRSMLLATLSSLSAACMMGPNYSRPAMPTPPQYRFDNTSQAQSIADLPWFQVFEDPTLQALVREALTSNLDLQVAVARVEEARARGGIARSFLYPQVDGLVNYGVRQASSTEDAATVVRDTGTTHQSTQYGFQLSWEIDLFGRLRRQHEAALAIV